MPRAQREAQILDVAGIAFGRGDFHSISMDEIAALAGISKPMLYAYFGSKEGLYVAYIARAGSDLRDRLVRAGGEDSERVRAPIEEFLAFVEEYGDGWRVLFRDVASELVTAEVARLREQIAQGVAGLLAAGFDAAGAAEPDAVALDGVAHAIVGAGEALASWWLEHDTVERERVADWFVRLVDGAVATLPTTL